MTGRSARFYTSGRFFMRTSSYSSIKSYDSSSVNFQTSKKQSPRFLLIAPWKLSQQICTSSAISLANIITFSCRISVASEKFLIEQNPKIAMIFFPGIIGSIRPPKKGYKENKKMNIFAKILDMISLSFILSIVFCWFTFLHIFSDNFRSSFAKSNGKKGSYLHDCRLQCISLISLLFCHFQVFYSIFLHFLFCHGFFFRNLCSL